MTTVGARYFRVRLLIAGESLHDLRGVELSLAVWTDHGHHHGHQAHDHSSVAIGNHVNLAGCSSARTNDLPDTGPRVRHDLTSSTPLHSDFLSNLPGGSIDKNSCSRTLVDDHPSDTAIDDRDFPCRGRFPWTPLCYPGFVL